MKLYEITYNKIYHDLDVNQLDRLYQIPANNELDAAAYLGQIFNKHDDYGLQITKIKVVG